MISPETIALVKERTDLVALIGESVKLARRGRSYVGCCPFHKEKTPSFHVSPERGFYHCFGCKESGSAVDFVIKVEGLTFPEAIRELADRAGIQVEETRSSDEVRAADAAKRGKDDLYAVNHLAATFFEHALVQHPLATYARSELDRRGLAVSAAEPTGPIADTLQAFRVGYAPQGWDALATFLRQQGVSPLAAEKVGLLMARSTGSGHYDRFRHRLMFAVSDRMGRVVAFSGRALDDPTPAEIAEHGGPSPRTGPDAGPPAKYMNSPESPIYTKGDHLFGLYQARHQVRQKGEAVLVEGNFDVVALHARGVGNVVAPLGTAFTSAQAALIKRYVPTVVMLFDPDAAGRKATRASRGPCREAGLAAKVASLPDGLDPDAFARAHGAAGIERVVKAARGLLEHLIDDALENSGFGGASLAEQAARVRAVATLLSEEDDENLRSMAKAYADRLAAKLTVRGAPATDLLQLERIMETATTRGAAPEAAISAPVATRERARSRAQVEEIALAVLGVLIDFPELVEDPEVEEALGSLDGHHALTVAAVRHGWISQKGLYADEFLAQIPRPIHSFAAGRLASPEFDAVGEAKDELIKNAQKLKRLSLLRENAAGVEELHRAEALGDVASEDALMREAVRRSREKLGLSKPSGDREKS